MNLRTDQCRDCGYRVSRSAKECRECGAQAPAYTKLSYKYYYVSTNIYVWLKMLLVIALLYFLVSISTNVNSLFETLPVHIQGSAQQIADGVERGATELGYRLAEEISGAINSLSTDSDGEEQIQAKAIQPKQSSSLVDSDAIETGSQLVEQGVETLVGEANDSIDNSKIQEIESELDSNSGNSDTSPSNLNTSENISNIASENNNGGSDDASTKIVE